MIVCVFRRNIDTEEDLARALFESLTEAQKVQAVIATTAPE
jgi:hypothetical protein